VTEKAVLILAIVVVACIALMLVAAIGVK